MYAFARLEAFVPRVVEFVITQISTLPKPSAATNAAAGFSGVAFGAFGTCGGRAYRGWRHSGTGMGVRRGIAVDCPDLVHRQVSR